MNASNYGSSESLFLSAPPTVDTSPNGLELRIASISRGTTSTGTGILLEVVVEGMVHP